MPVLDGFNVLDIMSENNISIPIVLVTAEATAANVYRAAKYAISDFISKPFNAQVILEKLGNIFGMEDLPEEIETYQETAAKTDTSELETYISKLTSIYKTFLKNIDINESHFSRVSMLMEMMLVEYSLANKTELDTLDIRIISKAAYFYDIGLMCIPTELALKKEELSPSERELYESHTVMGANIIWLNSSESCKYFVKVCSDICMHHHERYDGTGFPHGLKGADNSVYSQMCGIAAKFDSLFSKRKEITEMQFDFVINEMKFDKGAFSPELMEVLSKCRWEILGYYKNIESNTIDIGLTI